MILTLLARGARSLGCCGAQVCAATINRSSKALLKRLLPAPDGDQIPTVVWASCGSQQTLTRGAAPAGHPCEIHIAQCIRTAPTEGHTPFSRVSCACRSVISVSSASFPSPALPTASAPRIPCSLRAPPHKPRLLCARRRRPAECIYHQCVCAGVCVSVSPPAAPLPAEVSQRVEEPLGAGSHGGTAASREPSAPLP